MNIVLYSHINYAILIWGSEMNRNITNGITGLEHIPKFLRHLNTVHNKSVRALVCVSTRDPVSKIFGGLNLLKKVNKYYYTNWVRLLMRHLLKIPKILCYLSYLTQQNKYHKFNDLAD